MHSLFDDEITRRAACKLLATGAVSFAIAGHAVTAWADLLVPLGEDRQGAYDDPRTKTYIIEGVDSDVDQNLLPTGKNVLIRDDALTLTSPMILAGFDLTSVARGGNSRPNFRSSMPRQAAMERTRRRLDRRARLSSHRCRRCSLSAIPTIGG